MDTRHFVLVHGSCHGAWCWYKLKPLLEAAGHRVTVLDLAASGIDSKKIEDVKTLEEYSQPLLNFLGIEEYHFEKLILVGHSFGGMSIALAMEKYSWKIAVAVFLTAFMPDTTHRPSHVLEQFGMEDEIFKFMPEYMAEKMYQRSPVEDLELAKTLLRHVSTFLKDLSETKNFSKEGYGSVPRVYITCNEDLGISLEFQQCMIKNAKEEGFHVHVEEIKDAHHMPVFSEPKEVCKALLSIAAMHPTNTC
ncbi:hypothetical protein L6164_001012 [Bauhinia variegata]|uniref:Uncharacterized protein n=1 Tax=Bauhinia variegata TaxID=167791 RepID=A0ACB9Q889_BAUVA|nr:hypothetical protein L6164_001012 [Bauhinia variegata]